MPELPEVETIKRTLTPKLVGREIKDVQVRLEKLVRPDPRTFASQLKGAQIKALRRRGKVLLGKLSQDQAFLIHFRLTGQLVFLSPGQPEPAYTHILFHLDQGRLAYADLRQFGRLELWPWSRLDEHPFLSRLGPEPLEISTDAFKGLLQRSRRLKDLLLDQEILAGLGNIYVDESLFCAGLSPTRKANTLSPEQAHRLWLCIRKILSEAIALRGSSVRNYVDGHGQSGRFQERHQVYRRRDKPCPRCGTPIAYTRVAGRGTYFCPRCQG